MKSDFVFALENAGWPALLVDGASTILRANQAAVKLFGPALEGASPLLSAIWAPENSANPEAFLAHWERAPAASVPLKYRIKGNTQTVVTAICSRAHDGQRYFLFQLLPEQAASEGRTGESSSAQKQKLDCALQLARTVSLDFNNALTIVLGHTSLLLSKMEPGNPWRASLLEVEKSAAKAAEIASDLAAFSRQEKEVPNQAAGNLNSILQRTVESFQNAPGNQIGWSLQLERKLFTAKFDEAKMQQAFMKILENAVQAISGAGRITVHSRNLELAEATQDRNVRLVPGAYVCVEFSDTGCGIEPDVISRVFEPFFTTKRGGAHRGLGLAWVYGIVTNHGGGVAISSQPGTGTSVRVYLPAEKKIVRDASVGGDLRGSETILIVDDEDLLLTMAQTILSAYGYRVLVANTGQKALEIFSRPDSEVDLVVTDLVMPAMSGRELTEHIRRLSPTTRIICTSGYVWPANREDDAMYLQKPFTSQELLMKVKNALANTESTLVD